MILRANSKPTPSTIPIPGISVVAYQAEKNGDTTVLEIANFHHEEITILSSIENVTLNSFKSPNLPETKHIKFLKQPKFIEFTCSSSKKIYKVKVSKYTFPKNIN